jgi:regulator of protease activity HflC (stomatin/prohibitin superfamily)
VAVTVKLSRGVSLTELQRRGEVIRPEGERNVSRQIRAARTALVLATTLWMLMSPSRAQADSAEQINNAANAALQQLYRNQPSAQMLGEKAKAILVFPTIVKAGFHVRCAVR